MGFSPKKQSKKDLDLSCTDGSRFWRFSVKITRKCVYETLCPQLHACLQRPLKEVHPNMKVRRGITQPSSKVNQFINTSVCSCMSNIKILEKGYLKIFCLQGCSCTKSLCPKMGNNSTKNLGSLLKSINSCTSSL